MDHSHRVGDLELDEDVAFQRRAWRVQRVGWGLMVLLAIAAAAGLFGKGPLSNATGRLEGGELRYERLSHAHSATRWHLSGVAGPGGLMTFWIDNRLLQKLTVEAIAPAPARVDAGPDRTAWHFAAPQGGRVEVSIALRTAGPGRLAGDVAVNGGAPLRVAGWIYP